MDVKIEPQPDHLYAVGSGSFDHAQLEGVLKEIFVAASTHGLRKILIDIRTVVGPISALARYEAGETAAKLQREPIRLVVLGSETHLWPDRFFENVANNRGVKTFVTTDMAEALRWLRE